MTPRKEGATVGRDTVMTPEVVAELKKAFANAFTDAQACLYVGIDKASLYRYCEKYPKFATQKEALKKKPDLKVKMNILEAINSKDKIINLSTSKWWAERKMRDEFTTRVENINQETTEIPLHDSDKMRDAKKLAGILENNQKSEPTE